MEAKITKDENRALGYFNVSIGNTMYARVPYSIAGNELPGDLNSAEALKIAELISKLLEARDQVFIAGDRFKWLVDPIENKIRKVDMSVQNGVIDTEGRFFSFNNISKVK